MGSGPSIPRELTHERLFELTKDTRHVMNLILQYMLKEVTVRDFLALSNPTECKKYVLFMANTLYKYFYELQIEPSKDKRGVIIFRSIKDLTSSTQERDQEKQSLCLVLAYYYSRIFQIYGALALTLIDDISFMSTTGILTTFQGDQQRLLAPGQRQAIYGGAISDAALGNFIFLKSYLIDKNSSLPSDFGYPTKFVSDKFNNIQIFFKIQKPSSSSISTDPTLIRQIISNKGTFQIGDTYTSERYSQLPISVDKRSTISDSSQALQSKYKYIVTIGKITYYKRGDSTEHQINSPLSSFEVTEYQLGTNTIQYVISKSKLSLDKFLNKLFDDCIYLIRETIKTGHTPESRLRSDDSKSSIYPDTYRSTDYFSSNSKINISETDVVEELKLYKIIHNLTQRKPLGHCIARALQLLRNAPYKDEPGISYICKSKFFEVSGKDRDGSSISRSGIPLPGEKIDSSPGLLALSRLFYDTISIGTPKLFIGTKKEHSGKSSLDQYVEFMNNMSRLFGDPKNSINTLKQSTLHSITNKRDKDVCKLFPTDTIQIPNQTSHKIYQIVIELFQQQLQHSATCSKIFSMLFNIKKDPSGRIIIALSDNVLKLGIPEINRINYIAREQLVNYYTNCEKKYLYGIKEIIDSTKKSVTPQQQLNTELSQVDKLIKQQGHIIRGYQEKLQSNVLTDSDKQELRNKIQSHLARIKELEEDKKRIQIKQVRFQEQTTVPSSAPVPSARLSTPGSKPVTTYITPPLPPSTTPSAPLKSVLKPTTAYTIPPPPKSTK